MMSTKLPPATMKIELTNDSVWWLQRWLHVTPDLVDRSLLLISV